MQLGAIAVRPNLAGDAAAALSKAISAGQMTVGTRLPSEIELARQLGVSRPVVREAIAFLKADGLVESRQGLGLFVTQRETLRLNLSDIRASEQSILQFLEFRLGLEVEAAQIASLRYTADDMTAIEDAAVAMNAADDAGKDSAEHDLAFHVAIAEAAANPLFRNVLEFVARPLLNSIKSMREKDRGTRENIEIRRADHARIIDRIRARDAEGAGEAMRIHIGESYRRYAAQMPPSLVSVAPHPALFSSTPKR